MKSNKIETLLRAVIIDWLQQNTYNKSTSKKLTAVVLEYVEKKKIQTEYGLTAPRVKAIVIRVQILESKLTHPRISTNDLRETLKDAGFDITQGTVARHIKTLRDSDQLPKNDEEAERQQNRELTKAVRDQVESDVGKPDGMCKKLATYTKQVSRKVLKQLDNDILFVSAQDVREALDVVFWDVQKVRIIVAYIKSGKPFDAFMKKLSGFDEVPVWVIEEKWKEIKGRTEGVWGAPVSDRGIWHISKVFMEDVEDAIPTSSPNEPIVLEDEVKGDIHRVGTVIAPHFGIMYDPDIKTNLLRLALADLDRRDVQSIILAGRLFYIETTVAGGINKIGRDMYSGITVDYNAFAKVYQKRAREVFENKHEDELIFMTAEERFEHLLSGLFGVTVKPNSNPEFSGNIYAILGPEEERLAHIIAQAHHRYVVRVLTAKIKGEIKALQHQREGSNTIIRELEDRLSDAEEWGVDAKVLKELKEKLETAEAGQPKQEYMEELRDRENRTNISNVHPMHARDSVPRILNWMARRIEEAVPNCRVIGVGSTFIKWKNTERTMQVYVDDSKRPYGTFMAGHGMYEREYGLEDVVLTVNSKSKGATTLAVESLRGDSRKTALVCEPPILVDQEAVWEHISPKKASEKVISTVASSTFLGGTQVFEFHKANGVNAQACVPPGFYTVTADHIRKAYDTKRKEGSYRLYNQSHVSMLEATDPHFTSMNAYYMHTKEGRVLNVFEGFMELIRRNSLVFHYMDVPDDMGQYLNFAGYTNLHPKRLTISQVEEVYESFLKFMESELDKPRINKKMLQASTTEFAVWAELQRVIRGEHTVTEQLEKINDIFRGYSDVTKSILLNANRVGLKMVGRDAVINQSTETFTWADGARKRLSVDRRNLGIINIGSSNHFANTFDRNRPGLLFDSEILRNYVINLLIEDPELTAIGYTEEELRHLITAPRSEAVAFGLGVLKLGETEVCPVEMRPSPIKRGPWWDPLRPQITVDAQRADPPGFFTDSRQYRMFRTGDKHMGQVIVSGTGFYVMGLPGTLPDSFADMAGGIRPNSNGVTLNYVAECGLTSGPTRTIFVPSYSIAYYLEHPEEEFPLLKMQPQLL